MKKNPAYSNGYQPAWPVNFTSELDHSVPSYSGAYNPNWTGAPTVAQRTQTKTQATGRKRNTAGASLNSIGALGHQRLGISI
jgi:hypothetical protein